MGGVVYETINKYARRGYYPKPSGVDGPLTAEERGGESGFLAAAHSYLSHG